MVEICVRKRPGGLCSVYLHSLKPGDTIAAFIKHNPEFRPIPGKSPVILIGAGTGIAPFVGFIRHNRAHRPIYLYWGGRDPQSDFLYQSELTRYLDNHRLTQLNTAFSRSSERAYVQDKIIANGPAFRQIVAQGALILVCGGRDMARDAMHAIDEVIAPLNTSVMALQAEGRYLEDV